MGRRQREARNRFSAVTVEMVLHPPLGWSCLETGEAAERARHPQRGPHGLFPVEAGETERRLPGGPDYAALDYCHSD